MKELHALVDFENVQPSYGSAGQAGAGVYRCVAVPWPAPGQEGAGAWRGTP